MSERYTTELHPATVVTIGHQGSDESATSLPPDQVVIGHQGSDESATSLPPDLVVIGHSGSVESATSSPTDQVVMINENESENDIMFWPRKEVNVLFNDALNTGYSFR